MMVTKEQVKRGAMDYFAKECAEKAKGIGKFASYFVLPSIPEMVDKYMDEFRRTGIIEDLFTGDMIDLETAAARARTAMRQCGTIEMFGFKLDESDIEKLFDYIVRA